MRISILSTIGLARRSSCSLVIPALYVHAQPWLFARHPPSQSTRKSWLAVLPPCLPFLFPDRLRMLVLSLRNLKWRGTTVFMESMRKFALLPLVEDAKSLQLQKSSLPVLSKLSSSILTTSCLETCADTGSACRNFSQRLPAWTRGVKRCESRYLTHEELNSDVHCLRAHIQSMAGRFLSRYPFHSPL